MTNGAGMTKQKDWIPAFHAFAGMTNGAGMTNRIGNDKIESFSVIP